LGVENVADPLPGTNILNDVGRGALAATVRELPGVAGVPDGHAVVFVKQEVMAQVMVPLLDVSFKVIELAGSAGPLFMKYWATDSTVVLQVFDPCVQSSPCTTAYLAVNRAAFAKLS
jgi:hypothetical protein